MPEVQEQGNSIPSSLHYALTDSQCNKCGAQLEWKADFDDINSPKYTAKHCNQDYLISIDSVKVEMVKQSTEQGVKENTDKEDNEENTYKPQHDQQSKTITLAEKLKNEVLLQKKAKLGDGSYIAAEDR
jgi:DNA-directed RNA polymerase subunit M/transcription elongation factor TFIIS